MTSLMLLLFHCLMLSSRLDDTRLSLLNVWRSVTNWTDFTVLRVAAIEFNNIVIKLKNTEPAGRCGWCYPSARPVDMQLVSSKYDGHLSGEKTVVNEIFPAFYDYRHGSARIHCFFGIPRNRQSKSFCQIR